ncbi:5-carboxymethyl-2-hydroxymuconate Delta-isomerase [Streptomyces sp. AC555_RSS877]|uniref:5-carboxymethyl-2-hydroxymuconate Delta-isomerase n=1 Tax=Streptomyces sp. AC555_RSS877 TaxID=2823688 RepID=UPI001C26B214|nr:isomerase [Streptomyces sp. AC555_RSS877]
MPQITVDYSAVMAPAFDRAGFAKALHSATVEIAAAKPEACKTQFRRSEYTLVGFDEGHAIVHVTIGLLAGRTEETKARLTEAVVALLHKHVTDEGFALHATAEVRDLEPSYRRLER